MTPREVQNLIALAEHGKTRDMATYAQVCSKFDVLQAQIDMVLADKLKNRSSGDNDLNAFARWQCWAEFEVKKLRSQQHELSEEKEAARLIAVRSLAKVQALEILHKKAESKEILIKRRRAEQNGQPPDA